jgi:hypothetical protein
MAFTPQDTVDIYALINAVRQAQQRIADLEKQQGEAEAGAHP